MGLGTLVGFLFFAYQEVLLFNPRWYCADRFRAAVFLVMGYRTGEASPIYTRVPTVSGLYSAQ